MHVALTSLSYQIVRSDHAKQVGSYGVRTRVKEERGRAGIAEAGSRSVKAKGEGRWPSSFRELSWHEDQAATLVTVVLLWEQHQQVCAVLCQVLYCAVHCCKNTLAMPGCQRHISR